MSKRRSMSLPLHKVRRAGQSSKVVPNYTFRMRRHFLALTKYLMQKEAFSRSEGVNLNNCNNRTVRPACKHNEWLYGSEEDRLRLKMAVSLPVLVSTLPLLLGRFADFFFVCDPVELTI